MDTSYKAPVGADLDFATAAVNTRGQRGQPSRVMEAYTLEPGPLAKRITARRSKYVVSIRYELLHRSTDAQTMVPWS